MLKSPPAGRYVQHALHTLPAGQALTPVDIAFLADDTRSTQDDVQEIIHELTRTA